MEYTTNYNLKKPGIDEAASIIDLNDNFDIIDYELNENADDVDALNTLIIDNTNNLQGLIDDIEELLDTVYAKLTGKAGGQTLEGGIAASENLTLSSTHHATKGTVLLGTSIYDEINNKLGIGKVPVEKLDVDGNIKGSNIISSYGSTLANGGLQYKLTITQNITVPTGEVLTFLVPEGESINFGTYEIVVNGYMVIR